ncbi:MAG: hypothetical protein KF769_05485 [Parvibaculum sp.]|nr:hypothetical protein [Parvibaculum sp.]
MTCKPKKTVKPKAKAAAKPKAPAKPKTKTTVKASLRVASVEMTVKHAPEFSRRAQRQARGWSNGQPTGYLDGE